MAVLMPENPPEPDAANAGQAPRGARHFDIRNIALGALLLLLLLVFYFPAIRGGLVFDDDRLITMEDLRSLHGLWRIWFAPPPKFSYYPLLHTAMWLEHRVWGDTPALYHLMNIFQHAVAAWLVVAVMRRLSLPGAWLAAFVFALHPVNVETVAWISEQKNTLSTVFYLAAAWAWLRFADGKRARWYLMASGLFVCAVLSKTTTATLPATLLVILWWKNGRIDWKRDALALAPWFIAGAALSILSGKIEREGYDIQSSDFSMSFLQHCLLACREVWFYAWKLAWPVNLMFNYPRWQMDAAMWWQWLFPLGLLAVVAGLCLLARRRRGALAGFLFFAGNLFPVMGFLYVDWFMFSFVADHFQYVACLGIIVPLASAAATAARRGGAAALWAIRGGAGMLVFALSALTWRQCHLYQDMETFYQRITVDNPESGMAHYNFGLVLLKIPGRHTEAMGQMDEALRLRPDDVKLNDRIAQIFLDAHRGTEAMAALERSLKIDPNDPFAQYLYGCALAQVPGRGAEAIAHLRAAAQLNPGEAQTHIALGNALLAAGQAGDAIPEYEAAVKIAPDLPDAHSLLGNAFAATPNRMQDAIAEYEQSLLLNADSPAVHFWLGNALATLPDRRQEAIVQYEEALRLDPTFAQARQMLRQLQSGK